MPVNYIDMARTFKSNAEQVGLVQGHRLCPGCGAPVVVKFTLMTVRKLGFEPVVGLATGCLEVSTTIYPYTAWTVPYIHNAFENVAATMSGVETAAKSLKKFGEMPEDKKFAFIAFAGDGGTYDIGIQSLSGMVERGHKVLYVLYDNEGYMNTGNQRSGGTPTGSNTTTAPVGKVIPGKVQIKKSIVDIIGAHEGVYAATASISDPADFFAKVEKALNFDGPSFIAALSPCIRFWRIPDGAANSISKLAVETKYWPLYEIDRGVYRITRKPRQFKPLIEFLKAQGRFKPLLSRPDADKIVNALQEYVDKRWERLLALEEATKDKYLR
ncbi:MAG: pyruvate ferredoxin oxidoreductase [Thermotogaceae bacterium]|nr:pyruvate ferredoxin oxidoreductase [Thermotogaceae bacterium]